MMALVGLIIAWVASFFIPGLYFYVAAIGVVLFAGLAAWDTQRIKQHYMMNGAQGNLAVIGAMMLYASFMNMFIFLLHIFGGRD
jgi:FtsH-binding integral membrane protein